MIKCRHTVNTIIFVIARNKANLFQIDNPINHNNEF